MNAIVRRIGRLVITTLSATRRLLDGILTRFAAPSLPVITEFSPTQGFAGTAITIKGDNFSADRAANDVRVGGDPALVVSASPNELDVIAGDATATGPVTVGVAGRTATGPHDFTVKPYPAPGSGEDGPPLTFAGQGKGDQGTAPSKGELKVLVVLAHPSDRKPANATTTRNAVVDIWNDVTEFYEQASFNDLKLKVTVTSNWHALSGGFATYVDKDPKVDNVKEGMIDRVLAEATQAAKDAKYDPDDFTMIAVVLNLNGTFIRAWGSIARTSLSFKEKPLDIKLTFKKEKYFLIIQESADWGRYAHEVAHNLVEVPAALSASPGGASLGEDVYDTGLIDPAEATAQEFEMMGEHDDRPLFSGFYMEKLKFYEGATAIKELKWSGNPKPPEDFLVVAHGLTENTTAGQYHVVKLKVTSGLAYYVSVRQRPGTTKQVFDGRIPIGASTEEGGVVVTRVLTGTVNQNHQTRFITLMHDKRVLLKDDKVVDPARDIKITVVDDDVVKRPLVCKVRIEWGQNISEDPKGKFDLSIEKWDSNYQTPDIWVDRWPYKTYDNPKDSEGRPTGSGDKPKPREINQLYARVHNEGSEDAKDVKVTYYSVEPAGVGDNGNWGPLKTITIATIPKDGFVDQPTNWVPSVGRHSCLKVFIGQQIGEVKAGNNSAQENVTEFEAPASSIPSPVVMPVAVRNPLERPTIVYMHIREVPAGYTVHFPHSWLWLDPLEERRFELAIVPTEDYAWYLDVYAEQPSAAIVIEGFVPRTYGQQVKPDTFPASRMLPIGGLTAIVTPKRRVEIELGVEVQKERASITLLGALSPGLSGETVRVVLSHTTGLTWVEEVGTESNGSFSTTIDVVSPPQDETAPTAPLPLPGTYRAQAHTVNSPRAAEADSNIVFATLP